MWLFQTSYKFLTLAQKCMWGHEREDVAQLLTWHFWHTEIPMWIPTTQSRRLPTIPWVCRSKLSLQHIILKIYFNMIKEKALYYKCCNDLFVFCSRFLPWFSNSPKTFNFPTNFDMQERKIFQNLSFCFVLKTAWSNFKKITLIVLK